MIRVRVRRQRCTGPSQWGQRFRRCSSCRSTLALDKSIRPSRAGRPGASRAGMSVLGARSFASLGGRGLFINGNHPRRRRRSDARHRGGSLRLREAFGALPRASPQFRNPAGRGQQRERDHFGAECVKLPRGDLMDLPAPGRGDQHFRRIASCLPWPHAAAIPARRQKRKPILTSIMPRTLRRRLKSYQ